MLRLKPYTRFLFERYLTWAYEPDITDETSTKGKRLRASYALTAETVLFMNQSSSAATITEWIGECPVGYQLKLSRCLSLLEDSTRWAISAIGLERESETDFPEKHLAVIDLNELKIQEHPLSTDVLTSRYAQTCRLVHEVCPQNNRLKESLDRLIGSYLAAKDLTYQARELALCDRLQYLKRITHQD